MRIPKQTAPLAICAIALAAIAPLSATSADAQRHKSMGYVTAHSEFGNGMVSGPVRMTSKGPQVRLPGGTWVDCERSCKHTLRLKTVDFWQSEEGAGGRHALTGQPGLFDRWLRWEWNY